MKNVEVSGAQLAQVLGLSKSRITRLKGAGVLQPMKNGRFDLAASVRAYIGFLKAGKFSERVIDRRTELLLEQTRRLKIANDLKDGATLDAEDVRYMLQESIVMFTATLESIPGRMATIVAGMTDTAHVAAALREEIRRARTMLYERWKAMAETKGATPPSARRRKC